MLPVEALSAPPPRPPRRADAARNRERVLAAAQRLIDERGVDAVTMDDVARAAGVGKGTLYRGFGDKSGLAMALLDDRTAELQRAVLEGPAPLGPGAPPSERWTAFVAALLRHQLAHLDLVVLAETAGGPGTRPTRPSYRFWRQHAAWLLEQCGVPDPRTRAEVLLAGLSAEQGRHWTVVGERDAAELEGAVLRVAEVLARP